MGDASVAEEGGTALFRINDNQVIDGAESRYFDKVPMKFADYDEARFQKKVSRGAAGRRARAVHRPQHQC